MYAIFQVTTLHCTTNKRALPRPLPLLPVFFSCFLLLIFFLRKGHSQHLLSSTLRCSHLSFQSCVMWEFHVCHCNYFVFFSVFCNKLSGRWILLPLSKQWYYRDIPEACIYTYSMNFSYLEKPEGVTRIHAALT